MFVLEYLFVLIKRTIIIANNIVTKNISNNHSNNKLKFENRMSLNK